MKNLLITTAVFALLTASPAQAAGHIENLVGSTFTCSGGESSGGVAFSSIYTFFPNKRHTYSFYIPSTGKTLNVPGQHEYFYDGKVLRVAHFDESKIGEIEYSATYLPKKEKMILTTIDGTQSICDES